MTTRRALMRYVALPAGVALAACGGEQQAAPPPAESGPLTMRLTTTWTSKTRGELMEGLLTQFQQEHPRIKVERQVIATSDDVSYSDAVFVQLTTDSAADVIQGDPQSIVQWQAKGAPFLDITSRVRQDKSIRLDDFFPPRGVAWEQNGKLYGLPFQQSSGTTYGYCVTQFDTLNLPHPQKHANRPGGWWDWTDFQAALQAIKRDTDRDGTADVWGAYVRNSYQAWWGRFVESNGGAGLNGQRTKTTLDTPQAIEGFEFIVDLVQRYRVAL
ncbi:MAG: ABC transporter substrate-binding protein, partial [Chloroflexota bacterium]